jgi:hypothetical protein
MAKVVKNITIPQGSDFSKTFTSLESDGSVTNLTGYSAEAKLKKHSEALVSHSFTVGITSATGQVSIAMTSGVTTPLDSGRYYYDIRLTSSSEAKLRLAEGMALVTAGIST